MTAKLTASADGSKVLIGTAAEDALEIDATAKTILGVNGYKLASDKVSKVGDTMTGALAINAGTAARITLNAVTDIGAGVFTGLATSFSVNAGAGGIVLGASGTPLMTIPASGQTVFNNAIRTVSSVSIGPAADAGVNSTGTFVGNAGTVELFGASPFIDFKRTNIDFEYRIINDGSLGFNSPGGQTFRIENTGQCVFGKKLVMNTSFEVRWNATSGQAWEGSAENGTGHFILGRVGTSAGAYLPSGGGNWVALSDERAKQNLEPITDALVKVQTLRAVTGEFIEAAAKRHAFLIAQDVQKVLPEAVDDSREMLAMDYANVVPLLVAAIKELSAKVAELEVKCAGL